MLSFSSCTFSRSIKSSPDVLAPCEEGFCRPESIFLEVLFELGGRVGEHFFTLLEDIGRDSFSRNKATQRCNDHLLGILGCRDIFKDVELDLVNVLGDLGANIKALSGAILFLLNSFSLSSIFVGYLGSS